MGLTIRKIILPLVFFLLIVSGLLRLLNLTAITPLSFSSTRHIALNAYNHQLSTLPPTLIPLNSLLTQKEMRFLFDIILPKSPCNLLVFGLEEQYLKLQIINGGGTTVFLEDRPEKLKKMKGEYSNATWVYRVEYKSYAKDAYGLLKQARSDSSCSLHSGITSIMSKCKLALTVTGLPREVVKTKWDVIVVDGPGGDGPVSPGRMGSIFMAGALARARNGTSNANVVVHDVDRMIEKWFSWEFLCEENRISSKGRFWNFRIPHQPNHNSSKFCFA